MNLKRTLKSEKGHRNYIKESCRLHFLQIRNDASAVARDVIQILAETLLTVIIVDENMNTAGCTVTGTLCVDKNCLLHLQQYHEAEEEARTKSKIGLIPFYYQYHRRNEV